MTPLPKPLSLLSIFLSPQLLIAVILLSISVKLMTLDTSYKRNHTVFVFCDWLISLNIMSSWSIHVAAHSNIPILFKTESSSIVCVYSILRIHSSDNEHLGCFHLLAIVNDIMNYRCRNTLKFLKPCSFKTRKLSEMVNDEKYIDKKESRKVHISKYNTKGNVKGSMSFHTCN